MTTQSSIPCPSCGLPWVLIAGRFPLHTSKGETCRMSNQLPANWPLPPAPHFERIEIPPNPAPEAIKEPGRKVRSDKGTKRGQRKPPSQDQERVAAKLDPPPRFDAVYSEALKRMNATEGEARHDVRPPTKVEDWMKLPKIHSTALDSTMGDAVPKPHGSHVADAPRAGYVATAPDWQPLIHATYDEADDAATEALRGAAARVIIYWVTPCEEISNGLIRKRLGRVRKGKP